MYICTYLCICPSWPCWISDRCCTGGLCPRCCHDIGPVRFQGCKSPDPEETHGDIMKYHPYLEISLPKESQWYRDTKPLHWSEGMKSGSCQQLPSATSSCQGTGKMGLFPERFAWHCNCEPPGCWPFVWGALAALAATRTGSHLWRTADQSSQEGCWFLSWQWWSLSFDAMGKIATFKELYGFVRWLY